MQRRPWLNPPLLTRTSARVKQTPQPARPRARPSLRGSRLSMLEGHHRCIPSFQRTPLPGGRAQPRPVQRSSCLLSNALRVVNTCFDSRYALRLTYVCSEISSDEQPYIRWPSRGRGPGVFELSTRTSHRAPRTCLRRPSASHVARSSLPRDISARL